MKKIIKKITTFALETIIDFLSILNKKVLIIKKIIIFNSPPNH